MTEPRENLSDFLKVTFPTPNLQTLVESDAQYLTRQDTLGHDAFVQLPGGMFWYERDLLGVPFVFVTELRPARVKGAFGEQDVMRVGVCVASFQGHGGFYEPVIAQFSHRYLLAGLRNLTANELRGHVWTLARNPKLPMTPRGEYPIALKVYEHGIDRPEVIESEAITPEGDAYTVPAETMQAARERFSQVTGRNLSPVPTPALAGASVQNGTNGVAPKRGRGRPRKDLTGQSPDDSVF